MIGPNGAGKSTLINVISTLCRKTAGSVNICGYDLDHDAMNARRMLGVVPQEFNFNVMETPYEIVMNQARLYGMSIRDAKSNTQELLQQMGLWDKLKDLMQALSGGMKRRLMIARGIVHSPRLLLLDEPTVGIDIEQRRSMWALLKAINANGTTIILTTHYLEEAEQLCRHFAFIFNGKLIEKANIDQLLNEYQNNRMLITIAQRVESLPSVSGVTFTRMSDNVIEAVLQERQDISVLLAKLLQQNMPVIGVKNSSGALEPVRKRVFFLLYIQTDADFWDVQCHNTCLLYTSPSPRD